jgi:ribosome-binding protein aMBF1 (putative translation factor)
VCGRKFCSRCGIWRQLADFPPDGKKLGQPLHHCRTCENTARRYYDQQMTPAQLENRRERHRIYAEGQRRAAGVPPTTARRRRLTDAREAIYLSVEPLRELMKQTDALMSDRDLAARAGLPERTVWRVRHENGKVQLDVADKLAVALGTTSKLLWGEEW